MWVIAVLLCLLLPGIATGKEIRIDPGAGMFLFDDPGSGHPEPMRVWTYRPRRLTPDSRILFVLHGVKRDAERYRDAWIRHAETYNVLLVVPEFSREQFPGGRRYNQGNMIAADGSAVPEAAWSLTVIERMFDVVRQAVGTRRTTYSVFGHSAGAQFVHRLATFAPALRVDTAVAANAGWYTLPLRSEAFPYGLRGTSLSESGLATAFGRRLIVLLGEADTNPDDPNLRRSSKAMRQGRNRLDRGRFYFATAATEATRLGVPFRWRLVTVPGVGHSGSAMPDRAARLLFE